MATDTLITISAGLEAIDEKRAKLRKSFEDLQAHSSLLPSSSSPSSSSPFVNLKWDEIDSHFTTLQSNLQRKFALIKTLKPDPPKALPQQPKSKVKQKASSAEPDPVPFPARPELKSLCEKMDAFGLRNYLLDRPKERADIRVELPDAWKHAPDPAKLVVDAMQGISGDGSGMGPGRVADISGLRRVSVVLLEALMRDKVEIEARVKEKAMAIAVEWKGKLAAAASSVGGGGGEVEEDGLEKLCFLHLLATFGLVENEVFDMNELVEYAVAIARHRQAVELCRVIGFGDKIRDVIQKLIDKGKQLLAVKFIFQFELTAKFPPVPLLRGCVADTKKFAQQARRSGKNFRQSWNEAAAKAISTLRSVIKIIEEYDLESQLPKNVYLKRVENLEMEKNSKKRPAAVSGVNSQPPSKQQKQSVGKPGRKIGIAGAAAFQKNVTASSTVHPIEQPHAQMVGLLSDPYLSTPASAYGLAGSAHTVTQYVGTSADMYGLPRTHMSFSENLDPSATSLYPSESLVRPSYYDRSVVYSGYSYPPEYHPTYYPQ